MPQKDIIQDATSDCTMKIMLPNKVKLTVMVFNHGSPKQLLSHVQAALETIRQNRLLAAYNKAC